MNKAYINYLLTTAKTLDFIGAWNEWCDLSDDVEERIQSLHPLGDYELMEYFNVATIDEVNEILDKTKRYWNDKYIIWLFSVGYLTFSHQSDIKDILPLMTFAEWLLEDDALKAKEHRLYDDFINGEDE